MMPYCTPDDVFTAFGRVLTTGLTPTEVDPLCQYWSDYIDGWIASRYITPITPTPSLLKMVCAQLVWLDLLDRSPQAPDFIPRRIARIEDLLKNIAAGELVVPGADERIDIGTIASSTRHYTPVFGGIHSISEGYDPNRRQDEVGNRIIGTDPLGDDVDGD